MVTCNTCHKPIKGTKWSNNGGWQCSKCSKAFFKKLKKIVQAKKKSIK